MAQMSNLPPQAYTRDTLVKAIEWISGQPASVRERANSADLVVSYYLQARRKSDAHMEAPVSGEVFKADLKHLAEDLKQFEEPMHALRDELPLPPHAVHQPPPLRVPPVHAVPTPQPQHQPLPPPLESPRTEPPARGTNWTVDARSLSLATELKQRLNLSNEGDALRMLIQLGAEKVRELFP